MKPVRDRSPQVLVVDDEPFIVELLADALAAEGYEVDTAADGVLALDRISRRSYDLILSDLRMPGMDGLALYRELASRRPDLVRRMIFISGTSAQPEYRGFLEQTGVPVLPKPFRLEELLRLTRRLLSAH